MSISNIITHLENQHKAKLAELSKDKKARMLALEKQWAGRLETEKQKILDDYQKKAGQNLAQVDFQQKELYKKTLLTKKQVLIAQVFDDLYRELLALPQKDYAVMLEGALKKIPANEGVIQVAEGDAVLLQKVLKKSGRNDEVLINKKLKDRGFIYSNDKVTVDYTFAFVLKHLKDDSLIDLNNFLFA